MIISFLIGCLLSDCKVGVSLPFEGHWLAASVVAMKKKNITEIFISILSIRSDQL